MGLAITTSGEACALLDDIAAAYRAEFAELYAAGAKQKEFKELEQHKEQDVEAVFDGYEEGKGWAEEELDEICPPRCPN